MSLQYIRKHYGVPARRGCRVRFSGDPMAVRTGVVVGSWQQYVRIRMDWFKRVGTYHPTWNIEYLP